MYLIYIYIYLSLSLSWGSHQFHGLMATVWDRSSGRTVKHQTASSNKDASPHDADWQSCGGANGAKRQLTCKCTLKRIGKIHGPCREDHGKVPCGAMWVLEIAAGLPIFLGTIVICSDKSKCSVNVTKWNKHTMIRRFPEMRVPPKTIGFNTQMV